MPSTADLSIWTVVARLGLQPRRRDRDAARRLNAVAKRAAYAPLVKGNVRRGLRA